MTEGLFCALQYINEVQHMFLQSTSENTLKQARNQGGAFRGIFPPLNFKTLHSNFDICRNFKRVKMNFYIVNVFQKSFIWIFLHPTG